MTLATPRVFKYQGRTINVNGEIETNRQGQEVSIYPKFVLLGDTFVSLWELEKNGEEIRKQA